MGFSERSHFYGLASLGEAAAYLAHPLLGPRLVECTAAMLGHGDAKALEILGSPDDMKFQSSITLFGRVAGADPVFATALEHFFAGQEDRRTLALLGLG